MLVTILCSWNILFSVLFLLNPELSSDRLIPYFTINILGLSVFMLWKYYQKNKNFFCSLTFFIIGFWAVYLQIPLFFYLDIDAPSFMTRFVEPNYIVRSMIFASLGFSSFFIGYFLSPGKRTDWKQNAFLLLSDISIESLRKWVNMFCMLDIIVFCIFLYAAGPELYWNFSYYDGMYRYPHLAMISFSIHTQLLFLFLGLFTILCFLSAPKTINDFLNLFSVPFSCALFLGCIFFIFNGDRGAYLQIFISVFAIYCAIVRPLKLRFLILGIVILGPLLFYLGQNRNGKEFEFSVGYGFVELLPLNDLAVVYQVFNQTMVLFPAQYPHRHGAHMLLSISKLIPGLASTGFYENSTETNSGKFFTDLLLKNSYGTGTASLVDPYIDFGLLGVITVFWGFGLLLAWTERGAMRNFLGVAFFFYAIPYWTYFALYINRASILEYLRNYIYCAVVIAFVLRQNRHKRKLQDSALLNDTSKGK